VFKIMFKTIYKKLHCIVLAWEILNKKHIRTKAGVANLVLIILIFVSSFSRSKTQ
jgi:hypothetical protein